MRLIPVAVIVLAAVLLVPHHARAFSSDFVGGANADGSPQLADPDDQIRSRFGLGDDGGDSQSGSNHSSVHGRQPATEVITGQGVLAPNYFFSNTPPRH
jgi:hypothetical protein